MPETDQVEVQPTAASPEPAPAAKPRMRREGKATTVVLSTAETITTPVILEVELDALPVSAKLAAPYAFYDDENQLHSWAAGQIVTDHAELALLVGRGAIFEGV